MSTDLPVTTSTSLLPAPVQDPTLSGDYYVQRARFIPVRLTLNERKHFGLLEAAL